MIVSISNNDFQIEKGDFEFKYQLDLTSKLDLSISEFDQNSINEIVLWKVNRYVSLSPDSLNHLNSIDRDSKSLDIEQTKKVLTCLLNTKGIQLPMASTILRFRNPHIYQIIDQRVFRLIYNGNVLKIKSVNSTKNNQEQILMYLDYLVDLRGVCEKFNIPFESSDRVLYMADKRVNKQSKLLNY
jgi:thermostable 8-oxoguanine DNA glycosylase